MRRILVPLLLATLPLSPAAAVVAIDAPLRAVPLATPAPPAAAETALSFGEMAAAVGGFMIFAVAFGSRRRTVTA